MFFRILKKDLKRKKVMNAVLLSFILLAAMFVASGLSNVVSVMNGTDHYLKKGRDRGLCGDLHGRRKQDSAGRCAARK